MQSARHLMLTTALLAAPATGQRLDRARLHPITAPVRDAGTVDVTTGRWRRPAAEPKALDTAIYNNTCTWQTQAYYIGYDWCEEVYDEGRVPSPSDPFAPASAVALNHVTEVQVSYCTYAGPLQASGGYDLDLAFWDKLGGDCAGAVAPTPPPVSSTATAYFPLAGLGLPGSTAFGFQSCWVVTLDVSNAGFWLAADGEGTFQGLGSEDKFLWMQRQNTTFGALQLPGTPDGFALSSEPATGGFGACTYDIPCGVDAISGLPCGTGLDNADAAWINVDGIGVGSSSHDTSCANAVSQYGYGTNCYFWQGYPTNPLYSHWLVLRSDSIDEPSVGYCGQDKATSLGFGCKARLDVDDPSLATGTWSATDIPRDASAGVGTSLGVFLYTHAAGGGISTFSSVTPFGTLCLAGFERSAPACTPALLPGAQPGVCNPGPMAISVDCNGGALGIAVGEDVNVQLWYRDPTPANSGNANFSNAIFYTVQ